MQSVPSIFPCVLLVFGCNPEGVQVQGFFIFAIIVLLCAEDGAQKHQLRPPPRKNQTRDHIGALNPPHSATRTHVHTHTMLYRAHIRGVLHMPTHNVIVFTSICNTSPFAYSVTTHTCTETPPLWLQAPFSWFPFYRTNAQSTPRCYSGKDLGPPAGWPAAPPDRCISRASPRRPWEVGKISSRECASRAQSR